MKLCKDCANTKDCNGCEVSYSSPLDGVLMKISTFRARESNIYCGREANKFVPKDAPKPDPGEGWRWLEIGEFFELGDKNKNGFIINEQHKGIRNIESQTWKRRIQPDPGDGFRLLATDEVPRKGDYLWDGKKWVLLQFAHQQPSNIPVRRTTRPAKCRCCGGVPAVSRGYYEIHEVRCQCGCSGPIKPTEVEAVDGWNALHLEVP